MARYGTFRYGDGTLYGSSETPNLLWALEIDWDGDGKFSGANEARYMVDLVVTRGREFFLRDDGKGFMRMQVGTADAVLENVDGRFDPFNAASPLYPYITPGRQFRLRVKDGADGTFYPVMKGRIGNLRPVSGVDQVMIPMVDGTQALIDETITMAIQVDAQVDDLMHLVLDEVGWPADERAIDASTDTLPYWWADGVSAWDALNELAEGVLGTFFVAADGKATFVSRSHSAAEAVTLNQEELKKEIDLPQPWDNIRNQIEVAVRTRVPAPDVELWRLREATAVGAGETVEVWAEFTHDGESVPASVVTDPAATTDYTANTAADGGGSDLTADFTVTVTPFGRRAKVETTNGSATDGFITLEKIRGTALTLPDVATKKREDAASQGAQGVRSFILESDWLQDGNLAESFAEYLKTNLSLVRAFPEAQIEARPELQFALDLFVRTGINIPAKGIANVFQAARIEHRWLTSNGQAVLTTARFEPVPPAVLQWTFPVKMGEESYFAF